MSAADAAWLHMDRPTNLMVVNGLLWFDEPLDLDRVREVIRERLVERFPRFRQRIAEPRLGLGVPSWEDDPEFDLDLHLHRLALPAPGDKAALQALAGDLMATPLDRTKPLWHMYVIEGYGPGTAILTRMHHCIADGIALARVLLSLTDEQPDAGIAPPAPPHARGRAAAITAPAGAAAHVAGAAVHEGLEIIGHPGTELPGLVSRGAATGRALAKLLLTSSDEETVLRGKLGVARRVGWTDRLELDAVRATGHATGTTVNDVLLTAMTGALHRFLADRDSLVGEIRAMVPFNLRPLDQPLPRDLGNRFGLVYLPLPVGITDPRERLAAVHEAMAGIKHSPEGPLSYAILGLLGLTPLPVEQRLIDVFTPKVTSVMTNVPGPRTPVYFAGSQVAGVIAWVPAGGEIGMGVSIFSYDGGITVGLQVDPRLVPDPDAVLATFEEELAALGRMARASRPPRSPSPRARGARGRTKQRSARG
ncbi:MAG: wax ester/triacylglycerol synthase family O-acyltransferase [Solirubrobacterales bacterium]|nr:wax ester/triacylglycerol synthase family O-acyltransferase [Solirubrobacterales bacterium]